MPVVENLNATIIAANWKMKPTERAKARYNMVIVDHCICKGLDKAWSNSEYGALREAEGINFWYKESDHPPEWGGDNIIGKIIEVSVNGRPFTPLRVIGRGVLQGGINLVLSSKESTA